MQKSRTKREQNASVSSWDWRPALFLWSISDPLGRQAAINPHTCPHGPSDTSLLFQVTVKETPSLSIIITHRNSKAFPNDSKTFTPKLTCLKKEHKAFYN